MVEFIQWLSVCLSLSGMYLVIHKYRIGFIIWFIASIGWLYVFWVNGIGPRMGVEVVYAAQAIYGYRKWREKDATEN
jgi:nicotinamide riboside transporter PnuC